MLQSVVKNENSSRMGTYTSKQNIQCGAGRMAEGTRTFDTLFQTLTRDLRYAQVPRYFGQRAADTERPGQEAC